MRCVPGSTTMPTSLTRCARSIDGPPERGPATTAAAACGSRHLIDEPRFWGSATTPYRSASQVTHIDEPPFRGSATTHGTAAGVSQPIDESRFRVRLQLSDAAIPSRRTSTNPHSGVRLKIGNPSDRRLIQSTAPERGPTITTRWNEPTSERIDESQNVIRSQSHAIQPVLLVT